MINLYAMCPGRGTWAIPIPPPATPMAREEIREAFRDAFGAATGELVEVVFEDEPVACQ